MCANSKICWSERSLLTIQESFRPTNWISPNLKKKGLFELVVQPRMAPTDRSIRWNGSTLSRFYVRPEETRSGQRKSLVSNGARSTTRQNGSGLISAPFKYKMARPLGEL